MTAFLLGLFAGFWAGVMLMALANLAAAGDELTAAHARLAATLEQTAADREQQP